MPPSERDGTSAQATAALSTDIETLDTLDIASDRLDGAQATADFRGEPLHRTRYLIRKGLIHVSREGERIVASKRALRQQWRKATNGEVA
jgi:hypothetical protein